MPFLFNEYSPTSRKDIPKEDFGVPDKRKYPLDTPEHVKSAAHLINHGHITDAERETLARKIFRRARQMHINTDNMNAVKKVLEQVPPMSNGTSLGNAPPRTMAPYYDESGDELLNRINNSDTSKRSVSLDDIKQIVTKIHDKTERDAKEPTENQNCQVCTWCVEAQCRGRDVLPRAVYSPRDPLLSISGISIVKNPVKISVRNEDDVVTKVKEAGPGSRFYVHVNWNGSHGGHEFLLINIGFEVYLVDGQAGFVGKVDSTDYFKNTNYQNSFICRLDDKPLNEVLLKDATDDSKSVPWDWKLDIPYMKENNMISDEEYQQAIDSGMYTPESVQEAACATGTAALLNIKNQLSRIVGDEFDFKGGSLIPKFSLISKQKPEVELEVNINGQNVDVTPKFKGIPDTLKKKRNIAIMRAANIIADYAREIVAGYKGVVKEGFEDFKEGLSAFARDVLSTIESSGKEMIPVDDYPFNKVYHGTIDDDGGTGDPLFITPYKGIASIFAARDVVRQRLRDLGVRHYNLSYDEWDEGKTDHVFNVVHVTVKTTDGSVFEPFEIASKGYIYSYDISDMKDCVYRYRWMDEEREALLSGCDDLDPGTPEVVYIHYMVKPVDDEDSIQEYATEDGKSLYSMRKATNNDVEFIYFSELETVNENKDDLKVQVYLRKDAKESVGHTKIIMMNGKDIGVYQAYKTDYYGLKEGKRDWWYLAHIYIKPQYRGKGIGSDIIKKDIKEHDKILLQVMKSNVRAKKLYESLGFKVSQKNDHGGLVMRLDNSDKPKPIQEGVRYGLGATTDAKTYTVPVKCPDDMSEQENILYDILFTSDGFIEVNSEIIERIVLPYCKSNGLIQNSYNELYKHFYQKYPNHIDSDVIRDLRDNFEHYEYFLMNICPLAKGEIVSNNEATMTFDTDCSHIGDKNDRPSDYTQVTVKIDVSSGTKWEVSMIEPTDGEPISLNRIISPKDCGFVQEGATQDLKNGVNPYSDKLVFHVSPDKHLDGQVWQPRVPEYLDPYNPDDTGFEDNTSPRICFSTSIEGALNGITVNIQRQSPDTFDKMYVYIPEKPWKEYKHKTNKELVKEKLVYDANVTREVWITEPVRMKLYGVIRVDQVSKMKRKSVVPTASGVKDKRNYYTYKWHWVVKPKVLDKATKFDYSVERVLSDLCIDIKKFRYGLIKDGRLQSGNVSDKDYDKYWVFHSGQEVDEAGGGNCYDMVEYEAGYLDAFGVPYKKYFMNFTKTDGETEINTHTICVVPKNGKFIYLEQAFKRVVDEWGYDRQKTFDSLKDIFQYVADVTAEYENQDVNYGVWDYTDAKIDYGTPIKDFMDYIMKHCKMIHDGEAKKDGKVEQPKPTIKKEGYRVNRFGNRFFTEAKDEESLSDDMENITVGDLNLDDEEDTEKPDNTDKEEDTEDNISISDEELGDEEDPMGLPDYLKGRMSEEDLESFEQPDENISADAADLGSFGKDQSDVQNEYDQKEVTILMKLMASEADAMNEYMDGAKETNVDVLRRLYADIANEERFHMEQLLYAKCELTGEKYVPKDPEVKSEYEELLKMGMDEETAMQTAVDRCHIRGSIADDDTDERIEIQEDIKTMESTLMMFDALLSNTEMVMESKTATAQDVEHAFDVFTECCLVSEATYDVTAAETQKSTLSRGNKFGPIQLIRNTLKFLLNALIALLRKFKEFCNKIRNHSREFRRFVKNYGLRGLLDPNVSFYFINLKAPDLIDTALVSYLGVAYDTTKACAIALGFRMPPIPLDPGIDNFRTAKLNINGNIGRGVDILTGVQLVKSKFVLPSDDDTEEQDRIASYLFGYTDRKGADGRSLNTLNGLQMYIDIWCKFIKQVEGAIEAADTLSQNQNSVYYKNKKKYDEAVKGLETVTKACKAMVSAMQYDINMIVKISNDGVEKMRQKDQEYLDQNPKTKSGADFYEANVRNKEPVKPRRFSF